MENRPRIIWAFQKEYDNPFDMDWEEEHVCVLCKGVGCSFCDDASIVVRLPQLQSSPPVALLPAGKESEVKIFLRIARQKEEEMEVKRREADVAYFEENKEAIIQLIKNEPKKYS